MAVVYLHIGTMKTGTSAIQYFLHQNIGVLKEKGYCVPVTGMRSAGMPLYRNGNFLIFRSKKKKRSDKEKQVKTVRERGYKALEDAARQYENIILSDEAIWQYSHAEKDFWKNLVDRFREINCEVKVIVYLRRQDQLIESVWKQVVKAQQKLVTETFMDWIHEGRYERFYLDYFQQLQQIARVVGKENIIVRVYEKGQYGSSIYSDFLQAAGLTLTDEYELPEKGNIMASNISLQGNFIEIKRLINGIEEYRGLADFMSHPVMYASRHQMQRHPLEKSTMFSSYEELSAFMKQFEEDNRKVAEEYLGREDGRLFYEPVSDTPAWKVNSEQLVQDVLITMSETFCRQEKKIQSQQETIRSMQKRINGMAAQIQDMKKGIRQQKKDVASMYNSAIFRAYRKVRKAVKKQ